MLPARAVRLRRAEILPQHGDRPIQNSLAGKTELGTFRLQNPAQFRIDEGEEDKTRLCCDVIDHTLELPCAAHKRIKMFLNLNAFELRACSLPDSIERLSGRVGNQMQVIFLRFLHIHPQTIRARQRILDFNNILPQSFTRRGNTSTALSPPSPANPA